MVGDPPLPLRHDMIFLLVHKMRKLNNNHFSPNAISHKELNVLLLKAKKEIESINNLGSNQNEEFHDLIRDWTEKSQKILLMLKKNEKLLISSENSKSLMAFGAMGAHINMALQALKASDFDQKN